MVLYEACEFWTSKQRQASSLHEISYRACFKAELPRFFIERYSNPGDIVYDPFLGRGTTALEAMFLKRVPYGNDINPLSKYLIEPRLNLPDFDAIESFLNFFEFDYSVEVEDKFLVFYDLKTLKEITCFKNYFNSKKELTPVESWIQMVCISRLTGHSPGFFSVYTLPPNQAVTLERQKKINESRNQSPVYRDTKKLILKKTKSLLSNVPNFTKLDYKLFSQEAERINERILDNEVQLIVTSPPFLDVVDYKSDNWLKCWFLDIDVDKIDIKQLKDIAEWEKFIDLCFKEFYRILKPGGYVAFEVGDVKKGTINLDEKVIPLFKNCGFEVEKVFVNTQKFTKTSNIWKIENNQLGTNTNRIVLARKE